MLDGKSVALYAVISEGYTQRLDMLRVQLTTTIEIPKQYDMSI